MERISEYRCENCGHSWVGRQQSARRRQCSQCRSTRVAAVGNPNNDGAVASTSTKTPEASPSPSFVVPGSVAKDPEVYEKMKQLQLARLERQIAEEKEGKVQTTALERLDSIFKTLVTYLEGRSASMPDIGTFLETYCIWCGASRNSGMRYDNALGGWKCATCGHISV
jgi:ribosomal protein S27E